MGTLSPPVHEIVPCKSGMLPQEPAHISTLVIRIAFLLSPGHLMGGRLHRGVRTARCGYGALLTVRKSFSTVGIAALCAVSRGRQMDALLFLGEILATVAFMSGMS